MVWKHCPVFVGPPTPYQPTQHDITPKGVCVQVSHAEWVWQSVREWPPMRMRKSWLVRIIYSEQKPCASHIAAAGIHTEENLLLLIHTPSGVLCVGISHWWMWENIFIWWQGDGKMSEITARPLMVGKKRGLFVVQCMSKVHHMLCREWCTLRPEHTCTLNIYHDL